MPVLRAQPAVEGRRAGTILFMQARSRMADVRLPSDGMFPNQDKVRRESGTSGTAVRILAFGVGLQAAALRTGPRIASISGHPAVVDL